MNRFLLVILMCVLVSAVLLLRPLAPAPFLAHPHPATSYADAIRRVVALEAADGPMISPECRTRLMTHGARTARAVVLLHGLTNCPEQFHALGERLFADGANVLIPRLPEHGLADRMTGALAQLDARELCAATDGALDIARGLGDSVIVVGLSIGGVMAAWAAQERGDVVRAVSIAPLLGLATLPGPIRPAMARLMLLLPNGFMWWDPRLREHLPGPHHVYPRFATRALGQTMLLGAAVEAASRHAGPATREIVMVTVGGDAAVDNCEVARLVRAWRAHGARVTSYEFPQHLHLNHDIIDPEQVNGNPAAVYPVLEKLILR